MENVSLDDLGEQVDHETVHFLNALRVARGHHDRLIGEAGRRPTVVSEQRQRLHIE